jgi:hypothetical protein
MPAWLRKYWWAPAAAVLLAIVIVAVVASDNPEVSPGRVTTSSGPDYAAARIKVNLDTFDPFEGANAAPQSGVNYDRQLTVVRPTVTTQANEPLDGTIKTQQLGQNHYVQFRYSRLFHKWQADGWTIDTWPDKPYLWEVSYRGEPRFRRNTRYTDAFIRYDYQLGLWLKSAFGTFYPAEYLYQGRWMSWVEYIQAKIGEVIAHMTPTSTTLPSATTTTLSADEIARQQAANQAFWDLNRKYEAQIERTQEETRLIGTCDPAASDYRQSCAYRVPVGMAPNSYKQQTYDWQKKQDELRAQAAADERRRQQMLDEQSAADRRAEEERYNG